MSARARAEPSRGGAQELVLAAARVVESGGGAAAAFSVFRVPSSRWFAGNTYLFAYDLQCNVLFNAALPAREGTNVGGHADARGKLFHDAFVAAARSPARGGWVDYHFPRPGQSEPSKKWTFVKAVRFDGVDGLLACGFYPDA